jgi:hypothetical protein
MALPQPQLMSIEHLIGTAYRSPSWATLSASLTLILAPILALQHCLVLLQSLTILSSIERPSLLPAFRADSLALQARELAPEHS